MPRFFACFSISTLLLNTSGTGRPMLDAKHANLNNACLLEARVVRPEVVEGLLYGCASWTLLEVHYNKRMLLLYLVNLRKVA